LIAETLKQNRLGGVFELDEINEMINRIRKDVLGGFSIEVALEQFQNRDKRFDKFLTSSGEHPLIKETKYIFEFHHKTLEKCGVSNPSESIRLLYEFPNGYSVSVIYWMYSMNRWELAILRGNDITEGIKKFKDFSRIEEILLTTMFK
jgi:hypothetical protein